MYNKIFILCIYSAYNKVTGGDIVVSRIFIKNMYVIFLYLYLLVNMYLMSVFLYLYLLVRV